MDGRTNRRLDSLLHLMMKFENVQRDDMSMQEARPRISSFRERTTSGVHKLAQKYIAFFGGNSAIVRRSETTISRMAKVASVPLQPHCENCAEYLSGTQPEPRRAHA